MLLSFIHSEIEKHHGRARYRSCKGIRVVEQSGTRCASRDLLCHAVCPFSKCPAKGRIQAFQDAHFLDGSLISAASVVQLLWEADIGVATLGFRPRPIHSEKQHHHSTEKYCSPPAITAASGKHSPERATSLAVVRGDCHPACPVAHFGSQGVLGSI